MTRHRFLSIVTLRYAALAIIFYSVSEPSALGDTFEWTNAVAGFYTSAGNWTNTSGVDAAPPNVGDTAVFNEAGTYTVTMSSTPVASDLLQITAGNVTFKENLIGGGVYNLTTGAADAQLIGGNLTLGTLNDPATLNIGDDLEVRGGSTLRVLFGSDVIVGDDVIVATSGNGAILVDGAGSTFTATDLVSLGSGGNIGALSFINNSTGNTINGTLTLINASGVAGSTGRVLLLSGAQLATDNIVVGNSGSATLVQEATLTVDGANSELTMQGAATLTIGDDVNPNIIADVIVNNSGKFRTGKGAILIRNSGHLDIQSSGVFENNGPLTADGTVIDVASSGFFNNGLSSTLLATNGAQLNFNGDHTIDNGAIWTLQSSADYNTDSTGDDLFVGDTTDGTLIVEGLGSSLNVGNGTNGSTLIGVSGGTGTVTIRDTATAFLGSLRIADTSVVGTSGVLNIEDGAEVTVNSVDVATVGSNAMSGTINIGGTGPTRLTVNGSGTIEVGSVFIGNGPGAINITNLSGQLIGSTGLTIIRDTGLIEVNDGLFQANGSVLIDGGELREVNFGTFDLQPGLTLTANSSGQVNFSSSYAIDEDTTFLFQSGADFTVTNLLDIGNAPGATGTLTVEDVGSSMTVTSGLDVGVGGGTGFFTVRNGASASLDNVAIGTTFGGNASSGTVLVESAATVTSSTLSINTLVGPSSQGSLTIQGAGSSWTASTFLLGNDTTGSAELHVLDGGSFTTTSQATFQTNGTLTLDGGTVDLATHFHSGGKIDFISGSLTSGSDWTIQPGGILGHLIDLTPGKHLATSGSGDDLILQTGGTVILNGGSLDVDYIVDFGGSFQFNTGTLTLRNASGITVESGGPFGPLLSMTAGQTLNVTNALNVNSTGTLVVGTGANIQAGSFGNSGTIVLDGSAAALSGSSLNNGGILRGEGAILASVTNNLSGEIRAQAGKTLNIQSIANPNSGRINLQGGTLQTSSFTNGPDGNILGRGTLDVGGSGLTNEGDLALSNGQTDIFGDVTNQTTGRVIVSGNADVTFWDDVTDTGTMFNVSTGSSVTFFGEAGFGLTGGGDVFFEADVTPGSSPGLETFGGNVHFGVLSNLEIELSGTNQGSEYDALQIIGSTNLGGTLDVSLINGFMPSIGDSFEIINAASVLNSFAVESLPNIGPLLWNVDYSPTNVVLEVVSPFTADFDQDGDVDGRDFLIWQRGGSPNPLSNSDLAAWQAEYGSTLPLTITAAAVPEPDTIFMLIVSLCLVELVSSYRFQRQAFAPVLARFRR